MNFLELILLAFCVESSFGEEKKWWKNTVIYEIYPQSFYDSNNDGVGDLIGIQRKVGYLKRLGIGAVWLNPCFESPLKDNGYDISNYTAINPVFGTMDDFDSMLQTLNNFGIQVILDFVPNHTSDQHEWFKKSVKRIDPYTDYYVWKDPSGWENGNAIPPNNWESIFAPGKKGSAWEWNQERKQFYYHAFLVEQPDLNFRNDGVLTELKNVLKFWIDRGVRGFRVDAVPHLVEDKDFKDNPLPWIHTCTENLPETYEVIKEFRAYLDSYGEKIGAEIFLTTEGYTNHENTMKYYGDEEKPGAHFPFNFLLLTDFDSNTNAHSLEKTISQYLDGLKEDQWPNWVSGNHDWPRIPSRLGASSAADVMNALNLLLPGTATTYMGDELGMDSYWNMDKSEVPLDLAEDYRSPGRTPFQWNSEMNAGFTAFKRPWLPINPEYYLCNVADAENSEELTSLQVYKNLMYLRKALTFSNGKVETYALNDHVLAITRAHWKNIYVILVNIGQQFAGSLEILGKIPNLNDAHFSRVSVKSVNMAAVCTDRYSCGNLLLNDDFYMPPKSFIVLIYKTKDCACEDCCNN